jgi:hypothetical protein
MLAYIRNPKATMRYINNIPNQLLLAEVNIYILVLFFILYYVFVDPKDIYFLSRNKEKELTPIDYLYMSSIIHATVGLGGITIDSNIGKLLVVLHSISVILINAIILN